jgi:hypothetical protein
MEDTRGMFKPNFNLLWLLDVNKPSRQLVATVILKFLNMVDTRAMFKINVLLFRTLRYLYFEFEAIWRTRAIILNFVTIIGLM